MGVQISFEILISILLGKYPEEGVLEYTVVQFFEESPYCFPIVIAPFCILTDTVYVTT